MRAATYLINRRDCYLLLVLALLLTSYGLRDADWQGSQSLHTVMESLATLLAFLVGILALIRYFSQRDSQFLYVGTAFLGTGFLDAYHTVVTSAFFLPYMPSDYPHLVPWSWFASRLFLSVMLFMSWWLWYKHRHDPDYRHRTALIFWATGLATLTCFLFFALFPLPAATEPDWPIPRPYDFAPALFFVCALIGYLRKGLWPRNDFEHWLVLSLIVGLATQTTFMPFSTHLNDTEFNVAHLLKKLSYILVMVGLLINLYQSYLALKLETKLRIAAEKQSRESEAKLTTILDNVDAFIYLKDISGRYIYANRRTRDLFQAELGQIIGQGDECFFTAETVRQIHGNDRRVLDGGEVLRCEEGNVDLKTGRLTHYLTVKLPLRQDDGSIYALCGISTDISELKQIEAELRRYKDHLEQEVRQRTAELLQSNARLSDTQFAMDKAGIGIHWVDFASARFLYVNDYGAQLFGYTPAELQQLRVIDIDLNFTLENFQARFEHMREAIAATIETIVRHKDGHIIPISVTYYYQAEADDRKARFICFVSDITVRKQAEAQLVEAKNAAEAASRSKTLFLSNVSHELRTPLNAILGFTQLMERDPRIPEDQQRNIATINRSGNHLLALINDVLEISRIEAGRTTTVKEAFNLLATLNMVEEMIRIRAKGKGLTFFVDCFENLPTFVLGDAHHLRQVLINLLGNAVKYTEHGQVGLIVTPGAGQDIRFEVIDTGPGIATGEKEQIFHPFYQTEFGIAKGEGTGLGLAISRNFVSLMGGELQVESTLGEGSRFYFTIPLQPVAPLANATGDRIIGLMPGQPSPHILLVEDHPDNQRVAAEMLKQIDCEVSIASNGREGVELFQSLQPQLILMDMRMPEMDGYEATRIIRALPGGDSVPIVALTASAFEEDKSTVIAAGCNEMLSKPVEAQVLFETIGRILDLRFEYAKPNAPINIDDLTHLNALPSELRHELKEMVIMLDVEAAQAMVERLRADFPAEADLLKGLIEDYNFDRILTLLECSS